MRVLEGTSSVSLGMVKKKHRLRKKKESEDVESSDDAGPGGALCQHLSKAVNTNLVRKAIKQHGVTGKCMVCEESDDKAAANTVAVTGAEEDGLAEETVWLCLQCGNQGCGRASKYQHALKHHQTPRSACHALVVNLTSYAVWCYECDDEIPPECNKKLTECVELVKKQAGVGPSQPPPGKRGSQRRKDLQHGGEEGSQHGAQADGQLNKVNAPTPTQHQPFPGLPKVKGLSNLGNTCFFNAVMQNLSQTPILEVVLSEKIKKDLPVELGARARICGDDADDGASASSDDDKPKIDIEPLNITLAEGGTLSNSVLSFLRDMRSTAGKGMVVTPSNLFGQVCKKSPRFKGFQQQDSHELLRCLLDGMKAEEVKRSQHAILKTFNVSESTKTKSKLDEETRLKIKAYGHQVKHTFVDSIFGGLFISTVMCEECCVPSQIFEPFLDVSLPVTEEKTVRPNYGGRKKVSDPPTKVNNEVDDLFCSTPVEKPSKPMSKKERRKAKKEAKKKAKISASSKDGERKDKDEASGEENEESEGEDDDREGKEENDNSQGKESEISGKVPEEEEESLQGLGTGPTESSHQSVRFHDAPDHHASDDVNDVRQGVGMTAEEVAEQTRQNGAGDSLEDTDSNKANVTVSDQNLSDSDAADIEDNLDSMTLQENIDNNAAPECSSISTECSIECTKNDASRGLKPDTCVQNNTASHCQNGIENRDLVARNDKDAVRTSSQEALDLINNQQCSNSSAPLNKMDTQDCEEIKTILEAGKIERATENEVCGRDAHKVLSDSLKKLKLENPGDCENEGSRLQNGTDHEEKCWIEDSNKSNILKSKQVLSRPNTPQSPKLSRSSSMKTHAKSKHLKLEAKLKATRTLAPRYVPESHECSVKSCLNQFTAAELLTGNNKFGCETCTKRKYANVDKDVKREVVLTSASKQVLLFTPPAVLTLHLKRFQQVGFSFRKVSRHVDFPMLLDLAPYCSALAQGVKPGQTRVIYSLYGIVEHSGRLTGGHYTAFVKVRPHSTQHIMQFLQHCDIKSIKLERIMESLTRSLECQETGGAVGGEQSHGDGEGVSPYPGKWYYISDSCVSETTEARVLQCQAYLLFYERVL